MGYATYGTGPQMGYATYGTGPQTYGTGPQMGYATYGAATQSVILLNLKPAGADVSPPQVIAIQAR